jgi:hypothetical protein
MQIEHFKLDSIEEVELFSERIENFQKNKLGYSNSYININTAFINLQNYPQGGRLFTALLDLKLNFVMLDIDMTNAGGIWNQKFSKGKYEGGTVLDSQDKFDAKIEIQYHHANFVPRYRASWDKIMGIIILIYSPDDYNKFRRAKSRKKEFEKLCKEIPQISEESIKSIIETISNFDQNFRTPEVHGTGVLRKWDLTMIAIHETPSIDFIMYWNWLLSILGEIDKIIASIQEK